MTLVGARLHAEVVDVPAAQQAPERGADLGHREAELCGLLAVDLDHRLRQVVFQVGIEEHEPAALVRLVQKGARDLVQSQRGLGGLDHELHRAGPEAPGSDGSWNITIFCPATEFRRCCRSARRRARDGGPKGAAAPSRRRMARAQSSERRCRCPGRPWQSLYCSADVQELLLQGRIGGRRRHGANRKP